MRGYQQGRFSFNVKGGRCEACAGDGTIKIEMNFLPDVYVPCEVCHGARYNRETLEVHYKGKTIAEVLDMPIEEAVDFFAAIPAIARHMKTLVEVGLGYVRLGQPATTLSGGEAQRVKLSSELQKRSTGRTVYVLDEPTTGLHFEDIRKLLLVLGRLVDQGNTVLVIEHNLDVIKTADWLIDMGPEGGNARRHRGRVRHAGGRRRRPRQLHRSVPGTVARGSAAHGQAAGEAWHRDGQEGGCEVVRPRGSRLPAGPLVAARSPRKDRRRRSLRQLPAGVAPLPDVAAVASLTVQPDRRNPMPDSDDTGFRPTRRIVFHGLGALGVAVALAGCGSDRRPAPPRPRPTRAPAGAAAAAAAVAPPPARCSPRPARSRSTVA